MKRTVILNFPDDFQFPKEFNHEYCKPCPFFLEDDELEELDCCFAPTGFYACPFYGKREDEAIEIWSREQRERNRKMKHEKEWYTCDRCGEEIKEDIHAWSRFAQHILKRYKAHEYMQMISSEKYGYICNKESVLDELPEVMSAEIIRGYNKKNETIHLCGKCRKEFEKFMKMEKQ